MPIIFRILCKGLLYYAGRFHTRPVIDLVYVSMVLLQIKSQTDAIPAQPSGIEIEQTSGPSALTLEPQTLAGFVDILMLLPMSSIPIRQNQIEM